MRFGPLGTRVMESSEANFQGRGQLPDRYARPGGRPIFHRKEDMIEATIVFTGARFIGVQRSCVWGAGELSVQKTSGVPVLASVGASVLQKLSVHGLERLGKGAGPLHRRSTRPRSDVGRIAASSDV